MADLTTLLEVGGSLVALGGGADYAWAKHPADYWSAVGLPISTARLLGSDGSVMEACGLTVAPSRLRVLAVRARPPRGPARTAPPGHHPARLDRPTARSGAGTRRCRLLDRTATARLGRPRRACEDGQPGVVELRLVGFAVLRSSASTAAPTPFTFVCQLDVRTTRSADFDDGQDLTGPWPRTTERGGVGGSFDLLPRLAGGPCDGASAGRGSLPARGSSI